mgnify:CR=1 FL=1
MEKSKIDILREKYNFQESKLNNSEFLKIYWRMKKDLNDNSIIVNDSSLKFFYLANRNLEEPVFIKYEDLTEAQVLLIKKDYIKREVLKREALSWGLDKVDPVISSRLAQLGEQSLVNNLPEEEVSEEDLLSFYNKNNFLYNLSNTFFSFS